MHRNGAAPIDLKQVGQTALLLNGSLIRCRGRGNVSRTATFGCLMQTIEITDPLQARRCRYAMYRGERASMMLNSSAVRGMVKSVKEIESSNAKRWIITLVSKQGAAA